MLEVLGRKFQLCDGVRRRSFLKLGSLGLAGLSLADLLRVRTPRLRPSAATPRSFCSGWRAGRRRSTPTIPSLTPPNRSAVLFNQFTPRCPDWTCATNCHAMRRSPTSSRSCVRCITSTMCMTMPRIGCRPAIRWSVARAIVSANRIRRRHMRRLHEPSRLKRTDRQKRQADGREPPFDIQKVRPVRRISRKEDRARGPLNHIAAPQRSVAIERTPARGMSRRNTRNSYLRGHRHQLPPVQFGSFRASLHPIGDQPRAHPERNDKVRMPRRSNPPQRGSIHMVVVIVAQKHHVDGGQILKSHSGDSMPPRADSRKRACAIRPVRIAQDIHLIHLDEHGRVADKGHAKFPARNALGRRRPVRGVDPWPPRARFSRGKP